MRHGSRRYAYDGHEAMRDDARRVRGATAQRYARFLRDMLMLVARAQH